MLRRTLVVTVLLSTAVAAAAPAPVERLLRAVPANARAVVAVDVEALRDHPLTQRWLLDHQEEWSRVDDASSRFLHDAGIDPARDVDTMVLALTSDAEDGVLALFAGRFDPTTLGIALAAHGAEQVGVGSVTAYRLGGATKAGGDVLVRPTPDLVMVGSRAALIAAYGSTAGSCHLVAAATTAGELDPRAPFWMVAAIPPPAARDTGAGAAPTNPMAALMRAGSTLRRVAVSARLNDDLELTAFATATDVDKAATFGDAVKGALAAMRLAVADREPDLVPVLRAAQITVTDRTVTVRASLPLPLLQRLVREAPSPTATPQATAPPPPAATPAPVTKQDDTAAAR